MGRHVPPKRPYQCEPKRWYNTEDCNPNLSGLVNTVMYGRKLIHATVEDNHTATVFALPLYRIVRKNIAVHISNVLLHII
jgi:hypothetical protein